MAKNHKNNRRNGGETKKRHPFWIIPEEIKRIILGILFFLLSVIIGLSFFDLAGIVGKAIIVFFRFLVGKSVFILPLVCVLNGFIFLKTRYKRFLLSLFLASFLVVISVAGIIGIADTRAEKAVIETKSEAGFLGYFFGRSLFKLFGFWVGEIIFFVLLLIGSIIFSQLLKGEKPKQTEVISEKGAVSEPSFVKRIFSKPNFRRLAVESVPAKKAEKIEIKAVPLQLKTKPLESSFALASGNYKLPSIDLLEPERENPSSGDTRLYSAIIKKTLQNFDLPVEMSEINIGPTVTQYTLKPAEGIKLSRITALANDLSLALAAHPIRIEAPIPGRSLVGVEIPNKVRAKVRLRNLIEHPNYQNSPANLLLCLGRNVSGQPVYADLDHMPHLLVAGSTGTGKTIFLNSLILSLLYKNSPEILRLILIDPKRVEFVVYRELPHLLAPIICDAGAACNALKWLVGEMERRFEVLSKAKARDIGDYNEIIFEKQKALRQANTNNRENLAEEKKDEELRPLPYIVLIIDELADLMAAKGREIEAGIVRLAQMARAVGIHLVLATQRPSVEVVTGLIKANITSRTTFQVASQVDSRTVLDMAGAEKLLGLGDMLFISAEVVKPKRIQGAYVSEKELKKVVDFIRSQGPELEESLAAEETVLPENEGETLAAPASFVTLSLKKALAAPENQLGLSSKDDFLYGEAKRVVIEARKASASLLQRRLRLGYARAARLIDLLEERGVVGPGEGAKPREVYLEPENPLLESAISEANEEVEESGGVEETNEEGSAETMNSEDEERWKKV